MTRIHIIGGSGSGKTTLAKKLASHLDIPYYEIDVVGWENGHGALRPFEVRLRNIHAIAIQPSWVTDNSFAGWTNELLEAADVIVFLDLPWRVACWRIITRHLRASLAGTNRHKGLLKLYRFLESAKQYYTSTSKVNGTQLGELCYLQPYNNKVIRCRKPSDVEVFFCQVTAQVGASPVEC
jgi:adenylate kinase family enzyme